MTQYLDPRRLDPRIGQTQTQVAQTAVLEPHTPKPVDQNPGPTSLDGGTGGGQSAGPVPTAPTPVSGTATNALLQYQVTPGTPQMKTSGYLDIAKPTSFQLGGSKDFVPAMSIASQQLAQGAAGQQAQIAGKQVGYADSSSGTGNAFGGYLAETGAGMGEVADMFRGKGNMAAGRTAPVADFGLQSNALNTSQSAADQLLALEANQGPSAAQAHLQAGLNAAAASNRSIARSGRGYGGDAAAQSEAGLNNATMAQGASNQAAILRAQEDAAARQRAASNIGTAAGIQQGAASQFGTQAQANVQNALQDRAQSDAAAAQLYGLGLQAEQTGANTVAQGGQLALAGQAQAGQLATSAGQSYATGAQQQQNALTFSSQLAQQQLAASQAFEQARLQEYGIRKGVAIQQAANTANMIGAGISAAGSLAAGSAVASDVRAKARIKPLSAVEALLSPGDSLLDERSGEELDEADDPYGIEYGPTDARARSYAQAQAGDRQALGRASMARGSSSYMGPDRDRMASDMRSGTESRQLAKRRAGFDMMAGGFDAFRGAGKYITSDEREKTDLRPAKGYSYEYKDPERHGQGRFVGPMAQDLLKTPAGKSSVVRQPDGTLGVDTGRLALATVPAVAEQQRRQDTVDERVSALEQLLAADAEDMRGRRTAENTHRPKGLRVA